MNLGRYVFTHVKNCLHSIIVMAVAAIFISTEAQADGVILIKGHATQSPQFWRAFPFSKNEASPYNYNVTLLNGQQQNFFRTQVGAIFEEPQWNELIITSDADWEKLEQQKSKFLDSLGQFPQLKNWSDSIASKFDDLLDKNSSSVVVYKGRIISRDDYNKLRGQASTTNSGKLEKGVLAELTIGSVKLTNVKLKSYNETRVSLVHSNGIQGYNVADLKEAEISSLGKAFPEFAEYMKKHMAEDSPSPSISKMPTGIDKAQTPSNSPKLVTQASNMSDDSKLGVISKDYASLLGAKNVGSQVELPLTDEICQSFVMFPAGSFTMGSPLDEEDRIKRGEDQVEVILSQPFWLANTEVTQAQWEAVMGTNPSYFKGPNLPVENVNWMAVQAFIAKLNAKQILPSGWKFDLPTEAQWEYACRAGNKGPYSHRLDALGWYDSNSGGMTHKVGQKKPNAWGLYDMHGNVWEWCANWYYETLQGGTDPVGPSTGSMRASRGGSWFFPAKDCRAANRHAFEPSDLCDYLGFRPAIVRDEVKMKKVNDSSVELNSTSKAFEITNKNELFTNSLGMKFVHVPQREIMICIHETRIRDYQVFATEKGLEWEMPRFMQTPDHPAVNVNFTECEAFCQWLTKKEGKYYRLPTDEEWSAAVGLPPEIGENPKEKSEKGDIEIYPWGNYYPPTKQDGNFGLTEVMRLDNFSYTDDGYEDTAPVMSFKPNKFGIFDMGGNVQEWCLDWFDEKQDTRVTRGTSYFYLYSQEDHRSSLRFGQKPQNHDIILGFRCVIGSLIKENDQSKHPVISDVPTFRMSMTPSSQSKKGSSHLNLPREENDMLSENQKRQLEQTARAFGKDPHEVIRNANELAKKLQHDMMYPEDRGLREREESRRKSGFYGPGQ